MTFSIVVPWAARNIVTNPSIETGTTDWTGTVAQSSTRAYRGRYSLQVTPGVGGTEGTYYTTTLAALTTYTLSVYVWGAAGVPYRLDALDVSTGLAYGNNTIWTGADSWTRQSYTFTTDAGGGSTRLRVLKDGSASVAVYYVDAIQVEAGSVLTDYCDGDQEDCYWLNTPHAGMSERPGTTRAGGREYTLESLGWSVAAWDGLGFPSWQHRAVVDPAGGGLYRGGSPKERAIVLTLWHSATSIATLHDARKLLTDALGPKVLARDEPFLLRCDLTGATAEIACIYDDGLGRTADAGFQQTVELRLLAFQPRWRGVKDEAAILDPADSQTLRFIAARSGVEQGSSTVWDVLGLTVNPAVGASGGTAVNSIVQGPDGCIYVGGDFTNWAGIAAADHVVKYDPVTRVWSALDTGLAGGEVLRLAWMANGTLWAVGHFINVGGVGTKDFIAVWTPATSTWDTPGGLAGADGLLSDVVQGHDGYVYVTGDFANIGGVAAESIARWDGVAWSAIGVGLGGVPNIGQALAVGVDGAIFVAGDFTTAGGVTATRIARYSAMATTPAWTALGAGLNNSVYSLDVDRFNNVYAAGAFTASGTVSLGVGGVARWGGASWSALGTGVTPGVNYVEVAPNGTVYVVGAFVAGAGIPMGNNIIRWTGRAWQHIDVDLPSGGANGATAVFVTPRGMLYVGTDISGAMRTAGFVNVTVAGDAETYPRFVVTRSGGANDLILETIRNETHGGEILLRLPLLDGETVVVDLRRPAPFIASSVRGPMTARVVREAGALESFALRKGVNAVSVFVSGNLALPYVDAYLLYRTAHLTLDSVQ